MGLNRGKFILIVMFITIISKFFGFFRDMVLAFFFGAGNITDAYIVSLTIPEFLFILVMQTIAIGFIPIYTDIMHKQNKQQANVFTGNVISLSLLLFCFLLVIVFLFAKQIVFVFASGFNAETVSLAITFIKITVLAMFFRILISVFSAVLQANDRFSFPAAIGIPFDIIIILFIFIAYKTNYILLVWGVVIASFVQVLFLVPSIIKEKIKFKFSKDFLFDSNIVKMIKFFLPVAIGVGAHQINVLVDRTLASSFVGGISALNYANKVNNVIENIVILSLATVMFPTFSKYISQNNIKLFLQSLIKSINVVILLMLPCMVIFFNFSREIITFLFGRGVFDNTAIMLTSSAMTYYSIGLLFLSINVILIRAFYSLQKVKIVSYIACISVAVNIILNIYLSSFMGIAGLALATSIASFISVTILFVLISKQFGADIFNGIYIDLIKCVVFSIFVLFVSKLLFYFFSIYVTYWLSCFCSTFISILIYFVLCFIFKCKSIEYILDLFLDFKDKCFNRNLINN